MLNTRERYNGESGQTVIMFITVFAVLLLAGAAFAVSAAHLWMTKQRAQVAAQSACEAASMDMLTSAKTGQPIPSAAGFSLGVGGTCGSASSGTICRYAADNGFAANGSNVNVSWFFPPSISGTSNTPASGVSDPYLTVNVSQTVPTGFFNLFPGVPKTITVAGTSTCGVAVPQTTSATVAPGVILFSTDNLGPNIVGSYNMPTVCSAAVPATSLPPPPPKTCYSFKSSTLQVIGGGQTSIYSNSANFSDGGDGYPSPIDGTGAEFDGPVSVQESGPDFTGGNVVTVQTSPMANLTKGSTTAISQGAQPTGDPLSWLPDSAYAVGDVAPTHTPITVSYGQDGCPDQNGCLEFFPGAYSSIMFGTEAENAGYFVNGTPLSGAIYYSSRTTAIFMPGEYYMTGPLLSQSEVLRDATPCSPKCGPITSSSMQGLHPGENGILFYFAGDSGAGQTISLTMFGGITASGETKDVGGPIVAVIDGAADVSSVDPVSPQAYSCSPSYTSPNAAYLPPASSDEGTVLMAECDSNGAFDYVNSHGGSGPGVYDPSAPNRGILFAVSRSFANGASIVVNASAPDISNRQTVLAGTIDAFNSNYQAKATFLSVMAAPSTLPDPPVYVLGSIFVGGIQLKATQLIVEPSTIYTTSSTGSSILKAAQF